MSFETKTIKREMFFIYSFCFRVKNNRCTNVVLVGIFENSQQILAKKIGQNGVFGSEYLFLVHFQKYQPENICASIVSKGESKPTHK